MDRIETVFIATDVIQLDQLLKWMGMIETGGQSRFLIEAGKVQVNGVVVTERRKKVYPGECLRVNGKEYFIAQEIE